MGKSRKACIAGVCILLAVVAVASFFIGYKVAVKARDHVRGRALRGHDEMDAGRARELRDAADGELHLLAHVHHEVGQLVDDDDEVGQLGPQLAGRRLFAGFDRFLLRGQLGLHLRVVLADVASTHLREHFQAALHLGHAPRKRAGRLARLGDYGHVQVRDAVVGRELHAFRVDHDEAHLGRRGAHEDGHDHGVD